MYRDSRRRCGRSRPRPPTPTPRAISGRFGMPRHGMMHGTFADGGGESGEEEGGREKERADSFFRSRALGSNPYLSCLLNAPRSSLAAHDISQGSLDNSLRRSRSLSVSFSFFPFVSVARASRLGGSQARIHTRTQRQVTFSLFLFLWLCLSLTGPSHAWLSAVSSSSPRLRDLPAINSAT